MEEGLNQIESEDYERFQEAHAGSSSTIITLSEYSENSEMSEENESGIILIPDIAQNVEIQDSEPISLSPSPLSTSTKKRKLDSPDLKSTADEEDGSTCPICFEYFETVGVHRLVCLKCGHLFGESCIRRWIKEQPAHQKCCPQCKVKASMRDIRHVFAAHLRTRDNSKEVELEQMLLKEKQENSKYKSEIFVYKMELDQQRTNVMNLQRELAANKADYMKRETANTSAVAPAIMPSVSNYKLFMEKNLDLTKESNSKVMVFGPRIKKLLISQKSSLPLFPGFGIRFCDFATFRFTTFLNTGIKTPRDLCLNASEEKCMAATMEPTVKLFSLNNNNTISSYKPVDNGTIWSCAFDKHKETLLYLGSQSGTTYVYDQRNSAQVLHDIKSTDDCTPVINIVYISASDFDGIFPLGGFLVCQMRSLWFHEYKENNVIAPYRLNINGPISSMSFDTQTQLILITVKPSTLHKFTRYILAELVRLGGFGTVALLQICSYEGSKIALGALTIPTQVQMKENTLVAAYVQDNKTIQLWDKKIGKLQPTGMSIADCVVDTCAIYLENEHIFLGALSESKCRIFKIIKSDNFLSYVTRLL